MTLPQGEAFGLIALAVGMFAWGRFRYDLTSLGVLLAGVLIGVVPAKKAFDGFSNEIVIIIGAALIVSVAIARSGVVDAAMRPLLPRLKTEQSQVPALVIITMLVSMLTKNVGALAMLMPTALQIARRTGVSPGRLLMPMSFASLLGGLVTLIGTSPNIIVSEVRQEVSGHPFQLFDFAPVGLGLAAVGAIFLTFGYRLLPKDRVGSAGLDAALTTIVYTTEAKVPDRWKHSDQTVATLTALATGSAVTAIMRGRERLIAIEDSTPIMDGDILILSGEQRVLDELIVRADLELHSDDAPVVIDEPKNELRSVEATIGPGSVLVGRSAKRLDLQEQFNVKLIAVSRGEARVTEQLRGLRLREGDVLVLQATQQKLPELLKSLGCLPLAERSVKLGGNHRSYVPLLILAVAMALVVFQVVPVPIAFVGAAFAMVATGALPMREAYRALDGHVLVLIAALVPVSEAVRTTGGTELIAHALSAGLMGVHPLLVLGVLTVSAMMCAPFLHNVPTVLVLGPIAAALAKGLGFNPDAFLMAVAVGSACDFLTPIGHQCNTLVMGPGGYRFGDYARLGAPLSILVVLIGVPLIAFVWPLTRP